MKTQHSADERLVGVLADAAHELVMTTLSLARDGGRGSLAVIGALTGGLGGLTKEASGSADKTLRSFAHALRARFDDELELRMTRLLNAFHIPTSNDLHELSLRVAHLDRELRKANAANPSPSHQRRAIRKTNGRGA